jgi:hypothetical protein
MSVRRCHPKTGIENVIRRGGELTAAELFFIPASMLD